MSKAIVVLEGDTFQSLSRRAYGFESAADLISRANPGVGEPLIAGVAITLPDVAGVSDDRSGNAPAANPNEVALKIDGTRFRFWTRIRIVRSIDTVDIIEFVAPFEPEAPGFRQIFKPFSFKPIQVSVGGVPLFDGTLVNVSPSVNPERKEMQVSGYSKPGVLNDCTPPASMFDAGRGGLEFNDVKLDAIASALVEPFGIVVEFKDDPGAIFENVAIEPGNRIFHFLASLANQRNLIMASSESGTLTFQRAVDPEDPILFQQSPADFAPVAFLQQGKSPVLSVIPFFDAQEYYSHVTGIEPTVVGLRGSQFTVANSRLAGVVRPLTFETPDTLEADVQTAVQAKIGRMFGNAVSYSVNVASWRGPLGNLWQPNTLVELQAPNAMIYEPFRFIVRSVEFERDRASEYAQLNLVLPGSFSGRAPEAFPWD